MVIQQFTAMLLLLLLCQARAEWVQISQQHYRKPPDQPYGPYQPVTRPETTTEPGWNNQTLPRWKPATVQRVSHMGTIKRVHIDHHLNKERKPYVYIDGEDHDKLSLSLDKLDFIPDDDSNKRVVTEMTSLNVTKKPPSVVHEEASVNRNPFLTVVSKRTTTTTEPPLENVLHDKHIIPFKSKNRVYIASGGSMEKLTVNKQVINQEVVTEKMHEHDEIFKKYNHLPNVNAPFVTKQNTIKVDEDTTVKSKSNETKTPHTYQDKKERPVHDKLNVTVKDIHENITRDPPLVESENVKTSVNKTNVNTIENVLKIMKVVADTISRNTKSSFQSKIKYLRNLKNTILANIVEVRMESLWSGGDRQARSLQAASRGHVDFPSSESALMTISFLTFAVFLIKLVLQVIQKYKNKTMVMSPALVATVRRLHTAPAHLSTDNTLTYD